jgi:hypothetical protein
MSASSRRTPGIVYCTFHVDMLIIAVLRWIPTVKRIGDPHS